MLPSPTGLSLPTQTRFQAYLARILLSAQSVTTTAKRIIRAFQGALDFTTVNYHPSIRGQRVAGFRRTKVAGKLASYILAHSILLILCDAGIYHLDLSIALRRDTYLSMTS